MTLEEFKATLTDPAPPAVNELVTALWFDANGHWDKAHNIVQDIDSQDASWIHAYLHRKEGDRGNASYWYHRAHRTMPAGTLEDEWAYIAEELLKNG